MARSRSPSNRSGGNRSRGPRGRADSRGPTGRSAPRGGGPAPRGGAPATGGGGPSRPTGWHPLRLGGMLAARPLKPPETIPDAKLRVATFHPWIFKKMVRVDDSAKPGDMVRVRDKRGDVLGFGLFNPRSKITVRLLSRGTKAPDKAWWKERITRAATWRDQLGLSGPSGAYRLIHAEGDGLTGLVADVYGDVLSVEVFSLGIMQRIEELLPLLGAASNAKHYVVRVDETAQSQEGFRSSIFSSDAMPRHRDIHDGKVAMRVDFARGHKTGFFCDQRDNRARLGEWARGRVLDLCCHSGGFALHAAGGDAKVLGVDLDEEVLEVARQNARLSDRRVRFQHADAFEFLREAAQTGRTYDTVILDPPKLIRGRDEKVKGTQKYFDFNRLAASVVRPGGLLLTCSCSGLMQGEEFEKLVLGAVRQGRTEISGGAPTQLLARTGAGPDHPVSADCPETEYLKALWLRVG